MLPKPMELRELSTRFRDAVRIATDTQTKQRLSAHVLALAQVAQQIERDGSLSVFLHGLSAKEFPS
jgi:DNA-binding response OmpR family regulator